MTPHTYCLFGLALVAMAIPPIEGTSSALPPWRFLQAQDETVTCSISCSGGLNGVCDAIKDMKSQHASCADCTEAAKCMAQDLPYGCGGTCTVNSCEGPVPMPPLSQWKTCKYTCEGPLPPDLSPAAAQYGIHDCSFVHIEGNVPFCGDMCEAVDMMKEMVKAFPGNLFGECTCTDTCDDSPTQGIGLGMCSVSCPNECDFNMGPGCNLKPPSTMADFSTYLKKGTCEILSVIMGPMLAKTPYNCGAGCTLTWTEGVGPPPSGATHVPTPLPPPSGATHVPTPLPTLPTVHDPPSFAEFKNIFDKQYANAAAEQQAQELYTTRVEIINAHNALFNSGQKAWTMGVTQYADLTDAEFLEMFPYDSMEASTVGITTAPSSSPTESPTRVPLCPSSFDTANLPDEFDWRSKDGKNFVTPVKNQKSCGNCWAFAIAGTVESALLIKNPEHAGPAEPGGLWPPNSSPPDLSEQQLTDCCVATYSEKNNPKGSGNANDVNGCKGGSPGYGYSCITDETVFERRNDFDFFGGLAAETTYPTVSGQTPEMEDKDQVCQQSKLPQLFQYSSDDVVRGVCKIPAQSEPQMRAALVRHGPMYISVDVSSTGLKNCGSYGVCGDDKTTQKTSHAIIIVGYGHDDDFNLDYWTVRNSWGTEKCNNAGNCWDAWGNKGYGRIRRIKGETGLGTGGILKRGWFPTYTHKTTGSGGGGGTHGSSQGDGDGPGPGPGPGATNASDGLSGGAIAGIVIGCLIAVAAGAGFLWYRVGRTPPPSGGDGLGAKHAVSGIEMQPSAATDFTDAGIASQRPNPMTVSVHQPAEGSARKLSTLSTQ